MVLGDDRNLWYAKTCKTETPRVELINEIICAYFAQCWSLKIPEFNLIQIEDDVVTAYTTENGPLSNRYAKVVFPSLFFCSKSISPATELEIYFNGLKGKGDFKNFNNPTDLIKIGVFDIWIGNKDRKMENPNVLIGSENNRFDFCPIDHSAAFGYCTDYRQVNNTFMFLEERSRILRIPIVKSISPVVSKNKLTDLKNEILSDMAVSIENLDFIFDQIPASWGFSKKAKAHLKDFLSDDKRNGVVAESYINYLN